MTIRTRLGVSVVAVALVALLPAIYAVDRLRELHGIAQDLQDRHGAAQQALGEAETSLARADQLLRAYVADPEPDRRERAESALATVHTQLDALAERGYGEASRIAAGRLEPVEREVRRLEALVEADRKSVV